MGVVKNSKVRWLGHIQRKGERDAVKRVKRGTPEGRPLGRPRIRWVNEVTRGTKEYGSIPRADKRHSGEWIMEAHGWQGQKPPKCSMVRK